MKAVIVDSMLSQIRQAERQVAKAAGVGPIDQQMAFAEGMREHFASQQLPLPSQAVLWIMEPSPDRHNAVADVLVGKATLIESLLPAHMAESARKPRQEADCERAVRKLVAYLVNHDKPTTTEHLTRRMVGEWVSERVKLDHHWKTINKDLSFCSGLFKHAIRRGITELNPFSLQSLPKKRIKTKRAYTKGRNPNAVARGWRPLAHRLHKDFGPFRNAR